MQIYKEKIKNVLTMCSIRDNMSTVDAIMHQQQIYMREWLSGGAPPCQGGGRGFDPRLAL